MNEKNSPDKKQLDKSVEKKMKGLGLDALFHLVDVDQKDNDETPLDTHTPRESFAAQQRKNRLQYINPRILFFKTNRLLGRLLTDKIYQAVGLYITTHALRIIKITYSNNRVFINRAQYIPIPHNLKGNIDQIKEFVVKKLIEAKELQIFKKAHVCSFMARSKVILKFVSIPTTNDDEIKQMIEFEAEHHLPFPLNELEMDYHILNKTESKSNLAIVAIRKNEIASHIDLLDQAGIKPDSIDISAFALHNSFCFDGRKEGVVAEVNIDTDFTDINIVKDGVLKATRGINKGSVKLTEHLAEELNISYDAAQKCEHESGIILTNESPNETAQKASDISKQWADELASEINKTLRNFQLQKGLSTLDAVSLSGEGSRLLNLEEYLKTNLKSKVNVQALPKKIDVSKQAKSFRKHYQEFSMVFGLAQRLFSSAALRINLIPQSLKKSNDRKKLKTKALTVIGIFVVASIVLTIIPATFLGMRSTMIKSLDDKLAILKPEIATMEGIQEKIEIIQDYMSSESSALESIRELTILVSDDITINRFSFSNHNNVILVGDALSHNSVVDLTSLIRESSFFDDAKLNYSHKKDRTKEQVEFELVCTFKN